MTAAGGAAVRWRAGPLLTLAASLLTVLAASAPAPRPAVDPCAPPTAAAALPPTAPAAELTEQALRDSLRASDGWVRRAERRGRRGDLATALALRAAMLNQLGRPAEATAPAAHAVRLLAEARAEGGADPRLEPVVRAIAGETLQRGGQAAAALAQYDSGLAATPPALVAERARLCNDRGAALLALGDVDAATRALDGALALRQAAGDREGEAVVLNNQARVLQIVGRVDAALLVLRRALEVRQGLRNPPAEAVLHNNVGYAYDLLALPDSALGAYSRALAVLGGGYPSAAALTLVNRARARLTLGAVDGAQGDFEAARTLARQAGDGAIDAWVLQGLGRVHLARGEWDAAAARLDSARHAMHALGDRVRAGDALYFRGVAYHARGGVDALRQAVAEYARAADVRAAVARTAVRDEDRVTLAEQDLELTERWVLAWVGLREAGAPHAAAEALAAAERGRARALLDLMHVARPGPGGARGGLTAPDSGAAGVDLLLRPLRDERTPALSYLVTDSALVTWLALPDGRLLMDCARVPRATVNTLVRVLRSHLLAESVDSAQVARRATLLSATRPAPTTGCRTTPPLTGADTATRERVAASLGRLLLPPTLAAALPPSGDLVVVPHGVLALVPFAALPAPAGGAGPPPPLGVRYALRYAPSFAILAALGPSPSGADVRARMRGAGALVVGDPVMPPDPDGWRDFERLPSAGRTAVWLAQARGAAALTDAHATKPAVLARLPGAALVHLGTHGRAYAGDARARSSFVALAPVAGSDGLLRVADVLRAAPLQADLVMLSACQTGLGDLTNAEGTVGFQRAFLARGARGVLVSLWQVREAETDSLVRRFYRHWLDDGRTKAEALRRAIAGVRADQLAKTRGDPDADAANPYYWAGFQLVGAR